MGTRVSVIYICDVCGDESTEREFLQPVTVPAREQLADGKEQYTYQHIDVCKKCRDKLHDVVEQYYAKVVVGEKGKKHVEPAAEA